MLLLLHAAALGAVTGMRSMLGLALFSWLGAPEVILPGGPPAWLFGPVPRLVLAACALAELVADKLPKTPSRLAPGPLGARVVIGGICGALVMLRAHEIFWLGASAGAAASVAAAFAGNRVRGFLVRKTGAPDLVFALAEDVIAVGLGVWAVVGAVA